MRKGSDPERARRARMGLRLDAPPAQVHRDRRREMEVEVARAEMDRRTDATGTQREAAERLEETPDEVPDRVEDDALDDETITWLFGGRPWGE